MRALQPHCHDFPQEREIRCVIRIFEKGRDTK